MILDLIHIVVGIVVVACAVAAFLYPDKNGFLFPVIFWMAAFLNAANGWYKFHESGHNKKKKAGAAGLWLAALVLLLFGLISAASIWF